MRKDQYVCELAVTVNELFNQNVSDPCAEEIVQAYYGPKPVGGEVIEGVRKRLKKIKSVLEREYEHPVYLVSAYYYSKVCNRCPKDSIQARRCIPIGRQNSAAGIVLNVSDNDIVFQESLRQNISCSVPRTAKAVINIINAMNEGRMTLEDGGCLLQQLRKRMAAVDDQYTLSIQQDSLMQKALEAATPPTVL